MNPAIWAEGLKRASLRSAEAPTDVAGFICQSSLLGPYIYALNIFQENKPGGSLDGTLLIMARDA
jgi:hypothetical protein